MIDTNAQIRSKFVQFALHSWRINIPEIEISICFCSKNKNLLNFVDRTDTLRYLARILCVHCAYKSI